MYTDDEGPQDYPAAEEMSAVDVRAAIDGFVQAGKNAIEAGFNLVELHGANGYLIEQFFCPTTNLRTDEWGGAFEKRARFALEIVKALSKEIGPEKVGIRLSPFGVFNGIQPWETLADDYVWLAKELSSLGIAYLHLVDHSSMGAPALPGDLKSRLREAFSGAFILSGGYDKTRAESDLAEKKGDLVAFGRPFLANPDLVERFRKEAPLNEPTMDSFYTPGPTGYTDYPTLGALA
jgi:N-ethylmaleimide reductase